MTTMDDSSEFDVLLRDAAETPPVVPRPTGIGRTLLDGRFVILDFGLVGDATDGDVTQTIDRAIAGTPFLPRAWLRWRTEGSTIRSARVSLNAPRTNVTRAGFGWGRPMPRC